MFRIATIKNSKSLSFEIFFSTALELHEVISYQIINAEEEKSFVFHVSQLEFSQWMQRSFVRTSLSRIIEPCDKAFRPFCG